LGEQQRAAIPRALVLTPGVLILDRNVVDIAHRQLDMADGRLVG
jgi:ABC-type dipeptide/oligopeptide/nickel transport system ATPase subunit